NHGSLSFIVNNELVVMSRLEWKEGEKRTNLKVGQGIPGWVALIGKSYLSQDVKADLHYAPLFSEVNSEVAAPLKSGEEVIGVINIESEEPAAFTEDDKVLLEAFASQAVIAIQNAERVDALRKAKLGLEAFSLIDKAILQSIRLVDLDDVLQLILHNAMELT